ncbi:UNVERIFIED_CONTAM: hypothetical protein FKN15_055573, partial [Acipenser sinensis]
QALDRTIAKDERLAVGFFQRGAVHMLAGRLEEALSDCSLALKHFRGNSVIDYRQLGLRYQLHSWQTYLNTFNKAPLKVSPDKSRELSGNEKERKKHPTNSNPTPDNSIKADLNQGIKTQAQNSKEPSPTQPGNEQEETAEKKKPLSPSGEKEHSHGNIVKKTVSDEPEKDSINDGEGTDQEPKRQPPKQTKSAPSQVKYKARNQLLEEELSRIKARMNRTCSANLLKRPQR